MPVPLRNASSENASLKAQDTFPAVRLLLNIWQGYVPYQDFVGPHRTLIVWCDLFNW